MKRKILIHITCAIIFFSALSYFLFLINFSLFDSEETLIKKISLDNNRQIGIYYNFGNAVTQYSIQLKTEGERTDENRVIENFNNHNFLLDCQNINDSLIMLILQDTSAYHFEKIDTFYISRNSL